MAKQKQKFVKGNYVVCRYRGESGDVIVGMVLKTRAGKVHIKNLLTRTTSIRSLAIVERRNIVVPRTKAITIRTVFEKNGDKKAARKMAVSVAKAIKKAA